MNFSRSFITGSHAYGTPTEDSDIDLVVLVSGDDHDKLIDYIEDGKKGNCDGPDLGYDSTSFRFGNLNLICLVDDYAFTAWQQGTYQLKQEAPVTRERAIAVLSEFRIKYGVK